VPVRARQPGRLDASRWRGVRGRAHLAMLFITGYARNAAIGSGHLPSGIHVLTNHFR
jgi:hypothetical protein